MRQVTLRLFGQPLSRSLSVTGKNFVPSPFAAHEALTSQPTVSHPIAGSISPSLFNACHMAAQVATSTL